ncbi:MAG: hypothetical protein PWQ93_1688 [Clostridiales bacterium]|jgi:hypothetical protein|nr:hypothetical protein [Clostridiales bacterium]
MSFIDEILEPIHIPPFYKVTQHFPRPVLSDLEYAISDELKKPGTIERILPGQRIAIAVGSRGIANLPTIVKVIVQHVKQAGAYPFIVPAMGSHGGATGPGQQKVLEGLGITETSIGAPIISDMDVVEIARSEYGHPVYIDKNAFNSDGIIIINRIKPHTAFRGIYESGLMKMITIGLGKQKGAETCHALGFKYMAQFMPAIAKAALSAANILFGLAVLENAYDETYKIMAIPAEIISDAEPQLLDEAKAHMPRIMFDPIDVLIIDEIGKNISGDGMDPNITGRYPTPYASGGPSVSKMVILDLTDATHGNANGLGTGDITTRRVYEKIDWEQTYPNALTSTVTNPVKLPMVLKNDRQAIQAAIKTCNAPVLENVRIVRIKNTLKLGEISISQALLDEALSNSDIDIISGPFMLPFDSNQNLL